MRPWCRETPPRLEQAPSAWLTYKRRKQQHSTAVRQQVRAGQRALGVVQGDTAQVGAGT
jgi:hypothetical protein